MPFSLVSLLVDPRAYAALVLFVALARVAYALVSRLVAPYPRLRAAVEALAAMAPDVIRALAQLISVATGRPAPSLDLRAPDPEVIALRRRLDAAEARVAELAAAGAPAAPVGHVGRVDETTRAGRETIAPGMHGMMALLVVALAGCASGCSGPVITNPGAQVALRVAWPSVHRGAEGAGLCSDDPPEYLVGPTKHKDAGADDASPPTPTDAGTSPGAPRDASATAPSDGDAGAP